MSSGNDGARPAIAVLASRSLRLGPDSPAARFIRRFEPYFRAVLRPELHLLEGTYRSLLRCGLLHDYEPVVRVPPGGEGGLVALSDRVVSGLPDGRRLDAVVYFSDPRDATSLFPDSLALKRECVVTRTPFLASEAAAVAWFGLDWLARDGRSAAAGHIDDAAAKALGMRGDPADEAVALIAHDTLKTEMLAFADEHRGFLSRFGARLGTGTTGALLNGRIPERLGEPAPEVEDLTARLRDLSAGGDWVRGMASGPRGGDVQIAELVRQRRCQAVVFFEDPHVSREHEADIQLMERATRIPGNEVLCLHDPATAREWAARHQRCEAAGRDGWVTLIDACRRRWGVELVPVASADHGGDARTAQLEAAAWYIRALVSERARGMASSAARLRVGVGDGGLLGELLDVIASLPERLQAVDDARGDFAMPLVRRGYRRMANVEVVPEGDAAGAVRNAGHLAAALSATLATPAAGADGVDVRIATLSQRSGDTGGAGDRRRSPGDDVLVVPPGVPPRLAGQVDGGGVTTVIAMARDVRAALTEQTPG
ncbi:Methylglyoxal synthase [wastewater metagenome]|uniref:Methylglyoxal synthase n=2 Tax=unclassified sequences TaxID=12908 RepID=A0A5B8RGX8_9ZZZZ|nr:hypothetical protein [Arhodomonas sp. KWT]QEA06772.1 methylglyoxal synthase [uncultured organism]